MKGKGADMVRNQRIQKEEKENVRRSKSTTNGKDWWRKAHK
jgi:hypothetical protein